MKVARLGGKLGRSINVVPYTINNPEKQTEKSEFKESVESLDEIIKASVDLADSTCEPVLLTIRFKVDYKTNLYYDYDIPILPTCVDQRKDNPDFVRTYVYSGTPKNVKELYDHDVINEAYDPEVLRKQKAKNIKDYMQRQLLIRFAYEKYNSSKEKAAFIANLPLMKEFNLDTYDKDAFEFVKLTSSYEENFNGSSQEDYQKIYEFSKKVQTNPKDYKTYIVNMGGDTYVVRGKYSETTAGQLYIADADKRAAKFNDEISNGGKATEILYAYKEQKAKPMPSPIQKSY